MGDNKHECEWKLESVNWKGLQKKDAAIRLEKRGKCEEASNLRECQRWHEVSSCWSRKLSPGHWSWHDRVRPAECWQASSHGRRWNVCACAPDPAAPPRRRNASPSPWTRRVEINGNANRLRSSSLAESTASPTSGTRKSCILWTDYRPTHTHTHTQTVNFPVTIIYTMLDKNLITFCEQYSFRSTIFGQIRNVLSEKKKWKFPHSSTNRELLRQSFDAYLLYTSDSISLRKSNT